MQRFQIAFVTCESLRELLPDDAQLFEELSRRDLSPASVAWTDDIDWSEYRLALVRAPWDYIDRCDVFCAWADKTSKVTTLYNSARLLTWNADKRYLKELEGKGVPTIPTHWVPRGDSCLLSEVMSQQRWEEVVAKPCVASGSRGALRISKQNLLTAQAQLDSALLVNAMMVQPYLSSIEDKGEISLIYFGGKFSHAVQRLGAQTNGTFTARLKSIHNPHRATADELAVAERVFKALPDPALYARIDLIRNEKNQPLVIEVELIDPMLFLSLDHKATTRFANVIEQQL